MLVGELLVSYRSAVFTANCNLIGFHKKVVQLKNVMRHKRYKSHYVLKLVFKTPVYAITIKK
jgi:hypothetical protein